ncbi:endolytic transglycosylase MltG [Flaviaesturariibacter amylovorans]|uniref:Endolytic murein transglycosylase n=1 Tax=Flaviaesturariibacter amylovorans TaxID=1084520 RepID=A0ABP8GSL3_9BACT
MRRILLIVLGLGLLAGLVIGWILFGSGTGFSGRKATLYISSKAATREAVLDSLRKNEIVSNVSAFEFLANRLGYWDHIRPGKYEFPKGTGLLRIVRTLRNGAQTPVKLTITKYRTLGDFAGDVGRKFECDSADMMAFLASADSLRPFNATPQTAMTLIFPDTYTYYWNSSPRQVLRKLADVSAGYWTAARTGKAKEQGLSAHEAYTLASIVEEETNAQAEKGTIASVYLNRLRKDMKLQADPTAKYAVGDFTIRRVLHEHIAVASPYNTYYVKGLPPGPICTPQRKTLDAVLDAPRTNYYFFVANPDKPGTHLFTETYGEHLTNAKAYHENLNERARRNANTSR